MIGHYCVLARVYNRDASGDTARLREPGAIERPSRDEADVVRFRDNNGITVELRVVR